nr:unnamed protein product [Digitaria exilis]CAB3488438.1 unnamed protein product [Digitaria exilis]
MASALRPCPSGGHAVVGARWLCGISSPSSSSSPPRLVPAIGRQGRSISLVSHGLEGRRLRHRQAVRASKDSAVDWPFGVEPDIMHMTDEQFKMFDEELKKNCELDKDMPFREEIETIAEYWKKIASWNTSIFEMEATSLSLHLCMIATKGVKLASRVMESTALRLDKQDENHLHTTKQLMRSIMEKAMPLTILFISEMVARHKRVLGYIPGIKERCITAKQAASDEGGPMFEEQAYIFHEMLIKEHYEMEKFSKDMPFREDIEKIYSYEKAIASWNSSIFYIEAAAFSLYLCMIATKGVKLASRVMDSAALRPDKQDEISSCTAKQILKPTMVHTMTLNMAFILDVVARHDRLLGIKGWRCPIKASGDGEPSA